METVSRDGGTWPNLSRVKKTKTDGLDLVSTWIRNLQEMQEEGGRKREEGEGGGKEGVVVVVVIVVGSSSGYIIGVTEAQGYLKNKIKIY